MKRSLLSLVLFSFGILASAQTTPPATATPPVFTLTVSGKTLPTALAFTSPTTGQNCSNYLGQDSLQNAIYLTMCTWAPVTTVVVTPPPVATTGCTLPFTDSFTRANQTLATSTNWINPSNTISVASNAATAGPESAAPQPAWVSCPGFTTSQYAQFVFTAGDAFSAVGPILNAIDGKDYYFLSCNTGGACQLHKMIAGMDTFVAGFATAPALGSTICAELDGGTSVRLKVSGTYDPTGSIAVSGVSGIGASGIYFGNQGPTPAVLNSFQTGNGTCP
jgi:hypothetical protein